MRRHAGDRAGGDDHVLADHPVFRAVDAAHLDLVRAHEAGFRPPHLDAVARQLVGHVTHVRMDHCIEPEHQAAYLQVFPHRHLEHPAASTPEVAERKRGLAQRLAGDRAPMNARAPHFVVAVDHEHRGSGLGPLDGRLLSGRTAPDHRQNHRFLRSSHGRHDFANAVAKPNQAVEIFGVQVERRQCGVNAQGGIF